MMAATRRMSGSSARIDTPRHQNLAIAHRAEVATSLRPTGKLQHLIVPQRKAPTIFKRRGFTACGPCARARQVIRRSPDRISQKVSQACSSVQLVPTNANRRRT